MKAISLFSGVGGFDIGFERAGIETVLQVEKDEHCLSVLEKHWPNVERMTDVRATRRTDEIEGVDLIYGGFPCQDVSIAGKRAGLAGERSGLWFEFERIVSELRPRWVIIENVPGLLSSNGGADFGVILTGLDKLGFDSSWTVLDAQHFGVPQRRRRVFIVGGPRGRRAEQVLSLCESCGGNPETSEASRQNVTGPLTSSTDGSGRTAGNNGKLGHAADIFAATQITLETEQNIAERVGALTAAMGNQTVPGNAQVDSGQLVIGTLTAQGLNSYGRDEVDAGQIIVMGSLDTHLGDKRWLENQSIEKYGTMNQAGAGVRRLTPRECERLMGWPDDWTRWGANGTEISDAQRYRMCGNGVVATVSEWLGTRLMAVDQS